MKRIFNKKLSRILSLIFSFMLVGLFAHPAAGKVKTAKRSAVSPPRPQKAHSLKKAPVKKLHQVHQDKIQEEMEKYLGVRYKSGGQSINGFDCSGFTRQIYGEVFGIDLPRQSSEQNQCSLLSKVSTDELKTGDLVFFSTGRSKNGINHVGIYMSDGKFIHAARSNGVVISTLDDSYWKPRFVSAKRLTHLDRIMAGMDAKTKHGLGLALDDKNLLAFQVTTAQRESFYPSQAYNELLHGSSDSYYRMELSFLQRLWADTWNARITAFREHFALAQEDSSFVPRSILRKSDLLYNPFSTNYSQGLRVGSDIRPNEWLRVSPSITYFDYGPGVDFSDQPKVALGLDFNLFSSSDGWSLSTGFQYPLSRYASAHLSEKEMVDSRVIDMSLTFSQWLSDHVQFSVTGERFYRYSYGTRGSPYGLDGDDHQISFALRFLY